MSDRRHEFDAWEAARRPFGSSRLARRARWPRAVPSYLRVVTDPDGVHPILRRWDPAFIARIFPAMRFLAKRWYRGEVTGIQHLSDQAALMVSTHNGAFHTPDMYTLMVAFWERFGVGTPGHGLMHRAVFGVPAFGRFLERAGGLHATNENAAIALRAGRPVLVCPGGDVDALKPWRRRNRITFNDRKGFIRVALREQVPIIPIVSVGAHDSMFVVTDGRKLAEFFPFARRLRIKSIPLAFGFPFGLTPAGLGNLPLPTKVRQRILPPIHLTDPAEAADDPAVVDRWFHHVRETMQAAVDELAAERRWPVIG